MGQTDRQTPDWCIMLTAMDWMRVSIITFKTADIKTVDLQAYYLRW